MSNRSLAAARAGARRVLLLRQERADLLLHRLELAVDLGQLLLLHVFVFGNLGLKRFHLVCSASTSQLQVTACKFGSTAESEYLRV